MVRLVASAAVGAARAVSAPPTRTPSARVGQVRHKIIYEPARHDGVVPSCADGPEPATDGDDDEGMSCIDVSNVRIQGVLCGGTKERASPKGSERA